MNQLTYLLRLAGIGLWLGLGSIALAQYPDRLALQLSDSTEVTLLRAAGIDRPAAAYQYLPVGLRLSEREERPEISFLAYRLDSLGPISGGILHLLLRWGLRAEQLTELDSLLRLRTDSTAWVMGSLLATEDPEYPDVAIGPEDNPFAQLLRRSLRSAARPPLQPGGKLAISFSLNGPDATRLQSAWADSAELGQVYFRIYLRPALRHYAFAMTEPFYLQTQISTWNFVP